MRASIPMPFTTWVTSAPARSQMFAMALAKEILVERNALEAYLIISADGTSVMIIGRSSGAYSSRSDMATCWVGAPITIRSGRSVSSMAEPSRRNSGFDTTSNGTGAGLVALDDLAHELARAHRHGGLVDDDRVALHRLGDAARHIGHRGQVGLAVRLGRGAHRDEHDDRAPHRGRQVGGEGQPAIAHVARDHFFQAGLVDGHAPGDQLGDLVAVLVDADDFVAEVGEHGSRHEAYIARSNDTDVHEGRNS